MASTFRVLLVWLYGAEQYRDPDIDEELTPAQLTAFAMAAGRRPYGFGLVVRRNWRDEYQVRGIKLPYELRYLDKLPPGEAVNRLLGVQQGDRWYPGIAGVEPAEAAVVRRRVIERLSVWQIAKDTHLQPSTVRAYTSEARRKLRELLRLGVNELDASANASGRLIPIAR